MKKEERLIVITVNTEYVSGYDDGYSDGCYCDDDNVESQLITKEMDPEQYLESIKPKLNEMGWYKMDEIEEQFRNKIDKNSNVELDKEYFFIPHNGYSYSSEEIDFSKKINDFLLYQLANYKGDLYQKIKISSIKDINPEVYKMIVKKRKSDRAIATKKAIAAKKRAATKKKKEIEKAKKLLQQEGVLDE